MAAKDTDETTEKPEGENAEAAPKKKGPLDGILAMLPVPDKLKMPVLIAIPVLLILLIVLGLFLGGVFSPKKPRKCGPGEEPAQAADEHGKENSGDKHGEEKSEEKHGTGKDEKAEPCTPEQSEADADEGDHAKDEKEGEKPAYYEMPPILVNMDGRGRKANVLKMSVSIQVANEEAVHALEEKMPRVVDDFQTFLREVRVEDLRGSAGIYRLRQELLARIKPAVAPVKVKDILFKELLIQ